MRDWGTGGLKVTKIKSKQYKHTANTFSLLGRELEISDASMNQSVNKCRTKRGHCELYSKKSHIGGLADQLWRIKMLLVPMNFLSSG